MNCYAYLRVSGKGQLAGDGFTRQLLSIEAFALSQSLTLSGTYREMGISGENELDDRPALLELFETAQPGDTIIIEKLDRLARDLMIQESIIGDIRKRGLSLLSAHEPDLLATDPTRVLMRQLMGAVAQYEKAMIVAKLRGARQRIKARTGSCEGRKPFGSYPGEPPIIDRMRELRLSGLSYALIAGRLNTEGLRPRKGPRWYDRSVQRILERSGA